MNGRCPGLDFDPTDRYRRRDCRAAFARMEADGVIERARDGRRWLLFGGPARRRYPAPNPKKPRRRAA